MPGKVAVKIKSGRNLPIMDRSSDTTDAYVEIKLGNVTQKTDVCRKSLNPQWNTDWFRFEVDDAELQDEPLQIRLMDHDTYSANDAIGKVSISLNPLCLDSSGQTTHGKGTVLSGWIPVFDTMHGIRGEVNVIVKVDLFSDLNKFRQSSCGIPFFHSQCIPHGYRAQMIHGFVEELVVNDDPEYQWIDKIRTPRASNEARQIVFLKLSGQVQRKMGLKAVNMGANAVVGYTQCFDLEGDVGVVARGIGTAVTLIKDASIQAMTSAATDNALIEERTLDYLKFLTGSGVNLAEQPECQLLIKKAQSDTLFDLKQSNADASDADVEVMLDLLRQEDERGEKPVQKLRHRMRRLTRSSRNLLNEKYSAFMRKISDSNSGGSGALENYREHQTSRSLSNICASFIKEESMSTGRNSREDVRKSSFKTKQRKSMPIKKSFRRQSQIKPVHPIVRSISDDTESGMMHTSRPRARPPPASSTCPSEMQDSSRSSPNISSVLFHRGLSTGSGFSRCNAIFGSPQGFGQFCKHAPHSLLHKRQLKSSVSSTTFDTSSSSDDNDDDQSESGLNLKFDSHFSSSLDCADCQQERKQLERLLEICNRDEDERAADNWIEPGQSDSVEDATAEKVEAKHSVLRDLRNFSQHFQKLIQRSKEPNENQQLSQRSVPKTLTLPNNAAHQCKSYYSSQPEMLSACDAFALVETQQLTRSCSLNHLTKLTSTIPDLSMARRDSKVVAPVAANYPVLQICPSTPTPSESEHSQHSPNSAFCSPIDVSTHAIKELETPINDESELFLLPHSRSVRNRSNTLSLVPYNVEVASWSQSSSPSPFLSPSEFSYLSDTCVRSCPAPKSASGSVSLPTPLCRSLYSHRNTVNLFTNRINNNNANSSLLAPFTSSPLLCVHDRLHSQQHQHQHYYNLYHNHNHDHTPQHQNHRDALQHQQQQQLIRRLRSLSEVSGSSASGATVAAATATGGNASTGGVGNGNVAAVSAITESPSMKRFASPASAAVVAAAAAPSVLSGSRGKLTPSPSKLIVSGTNTANTANTSQTDSVSSVNTTSTTSTTASTTAATVIPKDANEICRRSSDSDLSVTPKGNSICVASDRLVAATAMMRLSQPLTGKNTNAPDNMDMLEYPFLTMTKYPNGFILHLGATVAARSVKLLERVPNPDEPEVRDSWWTELRMEIRSHARALGCNVVLGYSESTTISDDVCVLSATGTAAVINMAYNRSISQTDMSATKATYGGAGSTVGVGISTSLEEREMLKDLRTDQGSASKENVPSASGPQLQGGANSTGKKYGLPPLNVARNAYCTMCHIPYSLTSVPLNVKMKKCAICRKGRVPDVMLATLEVPEYLQVTGRGCFMQAQVVRAKKDLRSELNAKEISDGLPFLEYELHRLLINKLKAKGMNAIFGLKAQVSIGERMIALIATGTALFLSALPVPQVPKIVAGNSWTDKQKLNELQKKLQETFERNQEIYQLKTMDPDVTAATAVAAMGGSGGQMDKQSDTDESDDEVIEIDLNCGNKDTCVLEVDDIEDLEIISLLMESYPPDGFHVVNTQMVPGMADMEAVKNLQMFTQVWRAKLDVGQNISGFPKHFQRLLQAIYFKLRTMIPCAICDLRFRLDLPESDQIQLLVTGMALGLNDASKFKYRRKTVHANGYSSSSSDATIAHVNPQTPDINGVAPQAQKRTLQEEDYIFPLDEDHMVETPTPTSNVPAYGTYSLKLRKTSPSRTTSKAHAAARNRYFPLRDRYGVDITPLSFIPGGKIEKYLGNLNFFFIRESTSIRENGGISGFVHSFITELLAVVRAHISALGGNAMVSFYMTELILVDNQHKNQGQCLISVGGDAVYVSYYTDD